VTAFLLYSRKTSTLYTTTKAGLLTGSCANIIVTAEVGTNFKSNTILINSENIDMKFEKEGEVFAILSEKRECSKLPIFQKVLNRL